MKISSLLSTAQVLTSFALFSRVEAVCWDQCYSDQIPEWICRRDVCDTCDDACPTLCDAGCPFSVYAGAECTCEPVIWNGNCFDDQIGAGHELTARLDWFSRQDTFVGASRRSYLFDRQAFGPLSGNDNTMIAGALYTFSEETLRMTIMFPPLYPTESKRAQVQVLDSSGAPRAWRNCNIKDHSWHCRVRVRDLSMTQSYTYRIMYKPNTNDGSLVYTLRGSIPRQQGFPKVATVGCFGQDQTKNKQKLVDAIRAQDPDLIVLQGDQTYFHDDLLYGFFETIYSLRNLLKDFPTIVQMDDQDYGTANLWGAENDDEVSGAGFAKPPCIINILQDLAMGHNPYPARPATLQNGITIHYSNYIYGSVDFAFIEARKFKNWSPQGTILGASQEEWLENYCDDNSKIKVILSQTPFSNVVTNYVGAQGVRSNAAGVTAKDSNGYPVSGRESFMSILQNCGRTAATILSGDVHVALSVSYDDYGVMECTSPAAINHIFWRLSFLEKNVPLQDSFGNNLRLLDVYNVDQNVIDTFRTPFRTRAASDETKHLRGDGFLIFTLDESSRTCAAHGYRTGPQHIYWETSMPFDSIPPPPPTNPPASAPPNGAPPGYSLVWRDDFDGNDINRDNWSRGLVYDVDPTQHVIWNPADGGPGLLSTLYDGYNLDKNTYVNNGILELRNMVEDPPIQGSWPTGTFHYSSGYANSLHKVFFNGSKRGKGNFVELRANFPSGNVGKVWTAIWMVPESEKWPPEIDIWEYFGLFFNPAWGVDQMQWRVRYGPVGNTTAAKKKLFNFQETWEPGWHTYGWLWTREKMVWYIDRVEVGSLVNGVDVPWWRWPDEDMAFVLQQGLMESIDANDSTMSTDFPNVLGIDWMTLYEKQ